MAEDKKRLVLNTVLASICVLIVVIIMSARANEKETFSRGLPTDTPRDEDIPQNFNELSYADVTDGEFWEDEEFYTPKRVTKHVLPNNGADMRFVGGQEIENNMECVKYVETDVIGKVRTRSSSAPNGGGWHIITNAQRYDDMEI